MGEGLGAIGGTIPMPIAPDVQGTLDADSLSLRLETTMRRLQALLPHADARMLEIGPPPCPVTS